MARRKPTRTQRIADFTATLTRISRNTSQDRLQQARIKQIKALTRDRQLSVVERKSRIRLNDARTKRLESTATMRYCPKCVELFNPAHTSKCKTCGSKGVKMNVGL